MAIPFNPPEALIAQYMQRPDPLQQGVDATNKFAQTYLAMKQLKKQQENEALGQYVKAFEAGGPQFAQDVGKRIGLKNPPALPGTTAPTTQMGTAGMMPSPMNPTPAAQPSSSDGLFTGSDASVHPQAPMPMSDQPGSPMVSPIISHWNNTMGGQQQPMAGQQPSAPSPGAAPTMAPSAPSYQPPQGPAGVPGMENPESFMNQGSYGLKHLQAGEALGKYKEAMQTSFEKGQENSPRSANQLKQDFELAGQPDKADAWIKAHAPNALDNPDQPLINVAQIKEAKDWLGTGAMQQRGDYFSTMGNVQTQKLRQSLIDDAKKSLDPMFQSGEGRAQIQRLNNIGRTEPLIAQMLSQKDGGDPRQMVELATRVDSVLKGSPGGQQAIEGINNLVPNTAKGKFANWLEWFSNNPKGTEQQAFIHRYADTIGREKGAIQGQVKQTMERGAGTLRVLKGQFPDDYNAVVTPYLSGKYGELTGANVPTISGDDEFNALPSGSQFKDPSGQLHTKK